MSLTDDMLCVIRFQEGGWITRQQIAVALDNPEKELTERQRNLLGKLLRERKIQARFNREIDNWQYSIAIPTEPIVDSPPASAEKPTNRLHIQPFMDRKRNSQ